MTTNSDPEPSTPTPPDESASAPTPVRRLTRSRPDRMVAGVAGGLAEYFDIDPALVRVLLVVLALLSGGVALVLYIVA